jgi:lipopolysaccharide biosynthesis regulator YciM
LYIKAQYEKAIEIIKKYLTKYENSIKAYLLLAKIYKHKGDIKESAATINKLIEIDKDNISALNEAGNLYKMIKDYEKAIDFYNRSIESAPDNLYAMLELKDIYIKKGEWKNAYKMSKLFLTHSKDKNINNKEEKDMIGLKYEFGRFLLESENDLERSAKRFNQVIGQDKNFVPAYISLGDVYIKKGKETEAFKLWEKAFVKTGNFAIMIKIEDAAIKMNHPENIIKFYQELIYNNPEKWEYRLFLAKFYLRIEMVDEAISNLQAIPISIFKDNSIYLLLAESYLKRGKYNEAAGAFRNALKNQYPVKLPFICSNCSYSSLNFYSLCPSCHSWNTMNIKVGLLYDAPIKEDSRNIFTSI